MSRATALILASLLAACEPDLVAGKWSCLKSTGPKGPVNDAGVVQGVTDPLAMPWTTGFEDAFCGFEDAKGWCYNDDGASYTSVMSPVHSGTRAAAFSVNMAGADGGSPAPNAGGTIAARCAREGTFPADAYYGAWFYLPSLPQSVDNWNLFHLHGRNAGDSGWTYLWDVTLVKTNSGGYGLTLVDDRRHQSLGPANPPDVPVGSWFHVVLRFVLAGTNSELTLYQDDQLLQDAPGLNAAFQYNQWYVGNLVNTTSQPDLTVYVDDVSVSPTR